MNDEKVVAWLCSKVRTKWNLAGTEQIEETYTHTKVTTLRDEADALSAHGYTVEPLKPQSAYAELAAERDSFRDELSRWVHMLADKRAELQAAESQLAALRGSLTGLADDLESRGSHGGSSWVAGQDIRRTLAAADGGGK